MTHLSSILVYLCIDITQINFQQFFQLILLNMFKHTIIQQEMLKITVLIKQIKQFFFLIVQLEIYCGPTFLEFFRQNCKTLQNNQTLQKSAEINFTI